MDLRQQTATNSIAVAACCNTVPGQLHVTSLSCRVGRSVRLPKPA